MIRMVTIGKVTIDLATTKPVLTNVASIGLVMIEPVLTNVASIGLAMTGLGEIDTAIGDLHRYHPEFCVKKRLFKEVQLRDYYRHRQFLENILPIFQKGESCQ